MHLFASGLILLIVLRIQSSLGGDAVGLEGYGKVMMLSDLVTL